MGRLKPGATYIYERIDGAVYAREQGQPADTRIKIGETSIEEFLEWAGQYTYRWPRRFSNTQMSLCLVKTSLAPPPPPTLPRRLASGLTSKRVSIHAELGALPPSPPPPC